MKLLFENWRKYLKEEKDNIETIGQLRAEIEKAKNAKRKKQASDEIGGKAVGAAKSAFYTVIGTLTGIPLAGVADVGDLVAKSYSLPDEKVSGTALDYLQVDPELSTIIANDVENNFINKISDRLRQLPDETPLRDINMDRLLRDFIAINYDKRTITSPELEK